jgi:hypothetical protein
MYYHSNISLNIFTSPFTNDMQHTIATKCPSKDNDGVFILDFIF